ncbi:hypothetical protein A7Q09_07885 [Methylacidiphilum sp. Yel]|uniref:hypothetical protein n=1 Tax=Methylacidiphilum sp. Yel TaxID=1847730 RepID=UPI00106D7714|nr:hypothetical protein [Methylacidiphilum sp. Yel]TFE67774.1 hypothetical protein A7Q09_07885 [Methylacidiphilum sp. Yel]
MRIKAACTLLAAISLDGKFLSTDFPTSLLCHRLLPLEASPITLFTDLPVQLDEDQFVRVQPISLKAFEEIIASSNPFFLLGSPEANKMALLEGVVQRISLLWIPFFYFERKQCLIGEVNWMKKKMKWHLECWRVFPEGCACHYNIAEP